MKRKTLLSCLVLGLITVFASSVKADGHLIPFLLSPPDPIIGGALNASQFEVGVAGTIGGVNNWPAAEPPEDLINGIIGGLGEKHLNFARDNTGFIVTPLALTGGNPTIVTSIDFWNANDAEARDPASFDLYGTNVAISGAGPFDLNDFTLVASSPLSLPSDRDTVADGMGFGETVTFSNNNAYTSYMLIFPTVKDAPNANSMQLSEVQFHGQVVPEPSSLALVAVTGFMFLFGRNRR